MPAYVQTIAPSGLENLRTHAKIGLQYLPAAGGTAENFSEDMDDYYVAPISEQVLGTSGNSIYTTQLPDSTVKPVTLGTITEDLDSGKCYGVVDVRIDANGNEVDPNVVLASRAAEGTVLAVGVSVAGVHDAIGELHDFDPAEDVVAHVALVDNCEANADMRGTDDAYTGTPPDYSEAIDVIAGGVAEVITGIDGITGTVGESGVKIDMAQLIPLDAAEGSYSKALLAALTQGFGRWIYNKEAQTLSLYLPGGESPVIVFDIQVDDEGNPVGRTPQ